LQFWLFDIFSNFDIRISKLSSLPCYEAPIKPFSIAFSEVLWSIQTCFIHFSMLFTGVFHRTFDITFVSVMSKIKYQMSKIKIQGQKRKSGPKQFYFALLFSFLIFDS